jgi:hypothetical protein
MDYRMEEALKIINKEPDILKAMDAKLDLMADIIAEMRVWTAIKVALGERSEQALHEAIVACAPYGEN